MSSCRIMFLNHAARREALPPPAFSLRLEPVLCSLSMGVKRGGEAGKESMGAGGGGRVPASGQTFVSMLAGISS